MRVALEARICTVRVCVTERTPEYVCERVPVWISMCVAVCMLELCACEFVLTFHLNGEISHEA